MPKLLVRNTQTRDIFQDFKKSNKFRFEEEWCNGESTITPSIQSIEL